MMIRHLVLVNPHFLSRPIHPQIGVVRWQKEELSWLIIREDKAPLFPLTARSIVLEKNMAVILCYVCKTDRAVLTNKCKD